MSLFFDAKHKLRNIRRTIDGLLDGDFPLNSGISALKRLKKVFDDFDQKLDRAKRANDSETERQIASNISVKIWRVLPILGFILRSTNVRNAFEILEPLQTIADATLQGSPHVLLSSEWDYLPFAWPQSLDELKSFILIGLPASEAASALLVPLAGHELGHAVWRNLGLEGSVHTTIQMRCEDAFENDIPSFKKTFPEYDPHDLIKSEKLKESIGNAVDIAIFQAEELFSDMFAYAIFGDSYLYAFAYILAPGNGAARRNMHPQYQDRIDLIAKVAAKEGAHLSSIKELGFLEEALLKDPRERYILDMARRSIAEIAPGLWDEIVKILAKGHVVRPNPTNAKRHLNEFRRGIPTDRPECLGDIIIAGWQHFKEIEASKLTVEDLSDRLDHLNEMLLKSIEVLEFRKRIETDGAQREEDSRRNRARK